MPSDKDYQKIGQAIEKITTQEFGVPITGWRRFLWLNFVRGIMVGLGGVIGATVLIALIVWILSLFGKLPGVGHIFKATQQKIQQQ